MLFYQTLKAVCHASYVIIFLIGRAHFFLILDSYSLPVPTPRARTGLSICRNVGITIRYICLKTDQRKIATLSLLLHSRNSPILAPLLSFLLSLFLLPLFLQVVSQGKMEGGCRKHASRHSESTVPLSSVTLCILD